MVSAPGLARHFRLHPRKNKIDKNFTHDNEDTGIEVNGSNGNVLRQNLSWRNGDHGFDNLRSSGLVHIGNVAVNNWVDGFSFEDSCPNAKLYNCVASNNALQPAVGGDSNEAFALEVRGASSTSDVSSTYSFTCDYNLFWNPTSHPDRLIYFDRASGTDKWWYASQVDSADGVNRHSLQADPAFGDTAAGFVQGNFHPTSSSPCVDSGKYDSGDSNWPTQDAEGVSRIDAPATNTGTGSITYADRGAYEYDGTAPGQPTISVGFGRYDGLACWTARGNDGDSRRPTHYYVLDGVNVVASGVPKAPGGNEYVSFSLPECDSHDIQVEIVGNDGNTAYSNNVEGNTLCSGSAIADCGSRLRYQAGNGEFDFKLHLGQPYPNPAAREVLVRFSVPSELEGAPQEMALFDIGGRRVATILKGVARPGVFSQHYRWHGDGGGTLRHGVYYLRWRIGDTSMQRTVVLTR